MRLYHCIGGAFYAPLHPQRLQQVAHKRGFACTQVAVQLNDRVTCIGQPSQFLGERLRVFFSGPVHLQGRTGRAVGGFYNEGVLDHAAQIVTRAQVWGRELGFSHIGVTGVDLSSAEPGLLAWLDAGFHGDMHYMARHGTRRARPAELVPGTVSVITARMDYLPSSTPENWCDTELGRVDQPLQGTVSVYARGRDYHKVLRQRLQKLADLIGADVGAFGHRVFTDSAPVLEAELATRSGQGWRGKHTLVLNREGGSLFFLGEMYVDLALPPTPQVSSHCGECTACMAACPTQAIVAPYRLDARRCISYLTIEHQGPIPLEFRRAMGNRIYGCDDCQLVCPWNKYAQRSPLPDFDERSGLNAQPLAALLRWTESEFLRRTEGSAIRRIGHERWLRNLAVAAGNALQNAEVPEADRQNLQAALAEHREHSSPVVRDHVWWALQP